MTAPEQDEDLYPVAGGPPPVEEEAVETAEPEEGGEFSDEESALVPSSLLGAGVKAGDKVTVTIVKLYGDEAEISLAASTPTETSPMMAGMSADDEIDMMGKGVS